MRKLNLTLIFFFILVFTISCSEEEDNFLTSDTDYFRLEVGNSWNYDNQLNQNSETIQGSETLNITEQNQNRYRFSQTVDNLAGFYTSILSSGEVFKQSGNQQIAYDGQFSIQLEDNLPAIEIPLENVVLYDANLSQGNSMSVNTGEFQQNINGFPVDFIFEINSIHKGFLAQEVINNTTYEDVFVSEIQVSLSASVFLVITNVPLLQEQKVTTITNYYAKDVGLISSEVSTAIIFEDIPPQLEVEIPDVDFSSEQLLQDYTLNPDS
ncbi:hypothetical protein [Psychroflexus tropicus]|uniref:hypothetical protein n=1 Tax=Psychroflexus tropicus TaxID=197345 RepID=UPI00037BC787|nr:hypothetical protein [Psychroflexus tropicus]